MEEHYVWMTTRRIKPGTWTDFERAWRPDRHPEGMQRAYAYRSEDEQQIIGVSSWASKKSCDAWRGLRSGGAAAISVATGTRLLPWAVTVTTGVRPWWSQTRIGS